MCLSGFKFGSLLLFIWSTKNHSPSTSDLRARLAVKNQRRRRQAREERKRKLEEKEAEEAAAAAEKKKKAAEKRAATLEARRRKEHELARQHASAPIVVSSEQSLHELGQLAVAQQRLRDAADRLGREKVWLHFRFQGFRRPKTQTRNSRPNTFCFEPLHQKF